MIVRKRLQYSDNAEHQNSQCTIYNIETLILSFFEIVTKTHFLSVA
jgi:hypothetical protein